MRSKTIIPILIISAIAIILSSFTIGKQIFLGRQLDIFSFLTIHFAGYLFFFLMPVEILFIFYLLENFNIPTLLVVALLTAMIAQIIDYTIGYWVSKKIINKVIGVKKYQNMKKYIDKYGNLTVLVFNLFPLASSVLALVAGMLRFKLKNLVLYSFIGLLVKYSVIVLLFS